MVYNKNSSIKGYSSIHKNCLNKSKITNDHISANHISTAYNNASDSLICIPSSENDNKNFSTCKESCINSKNCDIATYLNLDTPIKNLNLNSNCLKNRTNNYNPSYPTTKLCNKKNNKTCNICVKYQLKDKTKYINLMSDPTATTYIKPTVSPNNEISDGISDNSAHLKNHHKIHDNRKYINFWNNSLTSINKMCNSNTSKYKCLHSN